MRCILLCGALVLAGCGTSTTPAPVAPPMSGEKPSAEPSQAKIKIKVTADGKVFADENEVTLEQLGERLAAAKEENAVVWYYRENGRGEPHPNAMEVIKQIAEKELPITLSSKPDYSDVIGADGSPRPR